VAILGVDYFYNYPETCAVIVKSRIKKRSSSLTWRHLWPRIRLWCICVLL